MNNFYTPSNIGAFRGATQPFGSSLPTGAAAAPSGFAGGDMQNILQAIPGIGDLLSSMLGGRDTQDALQQYQGDIKQGIGTQQDMLNQSLGSLAPFLQRGGAAGTQEMGMLAAGQDPASLISGIASKFEQSPEQKALVSAGTGALQNRLEAQGINLSGAADEALQDHAQMQTGNQLNQFISQALGGRQQTLGGLGNLTGQGLNAANIGTQARERTGENIASLLASMGQGQLAQGGAAGGQTASAIGGIGSTLASLLPLLASHRRI